MRAPGSLSVVVVVVAFFSGCELARPFEGPGFVLGEGITTTAPGPFHASATYLVVGDGAGDQAAFDGHMDKITKALETQEGLIGKSLSIALDGYRTLSVWESDEAVFGWVASDVHAAAMSDMADKTKSVELASWTMTREELELGPPSWDEAKARLDDDGRSAY